MKKKRGRPKKNDATGNVRITATVDPPKGNDPKDTLLEGYALLARCVVDLAYQLGASHPNAWRARANLLRMGNQLLEQAIMLREGKELP